MSRKTLLLSTALHAGVILLMLIASASGSPDIPSGGGDAIWVDVVTVAQPGQPAPGIPETPEDPVEDQQESPPEDQLETPEDPVEDSAQAETPETQETQEAQEVPETQDGGDSAVEETVEVQQPQGEQQWSAVAASGEAGAGAPGPVTYEGRVFTAIRRNFRTSIQPARSYRIEYTVNPDGTIDVETIRTSGDAAFDRAVEHALAVAQIPPFPAGRSSPAVLRIEFLGLEQQE